MRNEGMVITDLAQLLSIDVARGLVANGYGLGFDTDAIAAGAPGRFTSAIQPSTGLPYPPLAIVACTGNSVAPIVVTTAYTHNVSARGVGGMSCVISGVTGNTAANHVDADPRSEGVGLAAGILAVPTGPTTLALYGQSITTGLLVPLVGSGTYTGGGTITPALGDGSILLGLDSVREHGAPPRIVMVPRGSKFGARQGGVPYAPRSGEQRAMISDRSLRSSMTTFDFHCWGQSTPPDAAKDFNTAQALYEQAIQSSMLLFGADQEQGPGTWDDEKARGLQLIKAGHLFTFSLSIDTPILSIPQPFIPTPTAVDVTVQSPTPEIAAEFTPVSISPA